MNHTNLTIIVKVFNRKKALYRLLLSISENLSCYEVIILDDSFIPVRIDRKFPNINIKYIRSKIDVGLSKGRNIMLNEIKTDFFLLCEEDFLFQKNNGIKDTLEMMVKTDLDILGGDLYDVFELNSLYSLFTLLLNPYKIKRLNKPYISESHKYKFDITPPNLIFRIYRNDNHTNTDFIRTDQVNNFFLAKTNSIKKMGGWTPESLKLGEHRYFFVKAKINHLKIAHTVSFSAYHIRNIPLIYYPFRLLRLNKFHRIALEEYSKMGITNISTENCIDLDK